MGEQQTPRTQKEQHEIVREAHALHQGLTSPLMGWNAIRYEVLPTPHSSPSQYMRIGTQPE